MRPSLALGLGWTVLWVSLAGCTSRHDQLVAFVRSQETEVATGTYVVRPPDVISIHAPGAPEVDGATPVVRPDGKVNLRLLGEVDVAGLSSGEIAAKLKAQLSRYYEDPQVAVEVVGFSSQFFYVFGEVYSPGPKPFTGRDSLLKVLAECQPTFLAWRSRIQVLRPSPTEQERKVITVDLDRMLQEGDPTYDVLLQQGDIVQVPPTPLAWLGHRIREVLYPVEPMMNAYTMPAAPIGATHEYEELFEDTSDDSRRHYRRY